MPFFIFNFIFPKVSECTVKEPYRASERHIKEDAQVQNSKSTNWIKMDNEWFGANLIWGKGYIHVHTDSISAKNHWVPLCHVKIRNLTYIKTPTRFHEMTSYSYNKNFNRTFDLMYFSSHTELDIQGLSWHNTWCSCLAVLRKASVVGLQLGLAHPKNIPVLRHMWNYPSSTKLLSLKGRGRLKIWW